MTLKAQILNWLTIAFEQPTGSLTECFYYDKRDNEFFSVLAVDYFMFDLEMNIASNVTTSYTESQQNTLVDRIKRIEGCDQGIISVPRVMLKDRKVIMQLFVNKLTDKKLFDPLNQQIQNLNHRTEFDFSFDTEADEWTKQKWADAKFEFLHQKAVTFLNHNDIDIDKTALWLVASQHSISMDLTNAGKVKTSPVFDEMAPKKPWWKFW